LEYLDTNLLLKLFFKEKELFYKVIQIEYIDINFTTEDFGNLTFNLTTHCNTYNFTNPTFELD
jgi:hypothetical protein